MTKRSAVVCASALLALAEPASGQSLGFLCVPDQATGFAFKNGGWQQSVFRVDGQRHVFTETADEDMDSARIWVGNQPYLNERAIYYTKTEFGSDFKQYCTRAYVEIAQDFSTLIVCRNFLGETLFDTSSMRYIRTYVFGYLQDDQRDGNTPLIEIGRCVPL